MANSVGGDVVQLASPSEFTSGAGTLTFEGMVPDSNSYVQLLNQIDGISFDIYSAALYRPASIYTGYYQYPSYYNVPMPSGTTAIFTGGVTIRFSRLATEVGAYVSFPSISEHPAVPEGQYLNLDLRAYDAFGVEMGVVSVDAVYSLPHGADPHAYRMPFLGLRAPRPIAYVTIDHENPATMNGATFWVDDLTTFPPPPPEDTDGDGLLNGVDRCPTQNPGARDANHDGCTDTLAGAGTLINSAGLPGNTTVSLNSKLDNATSKIASGQVNAAKNQINALINEIQAQRGKSIPTATADMLIAYLQNVIASL
jgi:hypothetical protein